MYLLGIVSVGSRGQGVSERLLEQALDGAFSGTTFHFVPRSRKVRPDPVERAPFAEPLLAPGVPLHYDRLRGPGRPVHVVRQRLQAAGKLENALTAFPFVPGQSAWHCLVDRV